MNAAHPPETSSGHKTSRFTEDLPEAEEGKLKPEAQTTSADEARPKSSGSVDSAKDRQDPSSSSTTLSPKVRTNKRSPVKNHEGSVDDSDDRLSPSSSSKQTSATKRSPKSPPAPADLDDSSDGDQLAGSSVESEREERGRKEERVSQSTEDRDRPPAKPPRPKLPPENSSRARTARNSPPSRSSQSASGSRDRDDQSRRPSSSPFCSSWSCCCSSPFCVLSHWRGWSWIRVRLPHVLGPAVAVLMVAPKLTGPTSGIWYCQVGDTKLGGLGFCQE